MKIHRHQDGYVFLRDDQNKTLYQGSVNEFVAEHGTIPDLPAGMTSYIYHADARIMVYYDAFQNAFPVEGKRDEPTLLDAVSQKDQLIGKMVARETKKVADAIAAINERSKVNVGQITIAVP